MRRLTLRSAGEQILAIPKHKLQTYGLNAFSVAASTLWNKLSGYFRYSKSLKVQKKMLKHSYSNKLLLLTYSKYLALSFILQCLRTGLPGFDDDDD